MGRLHTVSFGSLNGMITNHVSFGSLNGAITYHVRLGSLNGAITPHHVSFGSLKWGDYTLLVLAR